MTATLPKSKFSLKEGMSDKQLWHKLNEVGISGESRQEVKLFKEPEVGHTKYENIPLHNVIMSNEKYAVLRKSYVYVDIFGSLHESWTYYWCGINDEHKYFIRPIKEFPWTAKPTIQEIADWVDRKDEGFVRRAQGDVLIKFIHKETIPELKREVKKDRKQKKSIFKSRGSGLMIATRPPHHGLNLDEIFLQRRSGTKRYSSSVVIDGFEFDEVQDKPLKLGNHKLFVDGKIYASTEMPYVAVNADSLILQHYEHKTEEIKIPDEHVAILTAQRGRDFELKNLQYLRQGFD